MTPAAAQAEPGGDTQAELSQQLEVVVEHYNALRDDLRTTVAQIGVLKRQSGPLKVKIQQHRARIGEIAAAAYISSGTAQVNALLRAESAPDLINNLLMIDSLARDQRAEIAQLDAVQNRYAAAQRTLTELLDQGREQQRLLIADRARIEGDIAQLRRLRATSPGPSRTAPAPTTWVKPEVSGAPGKVLDFVLAQLGKPYQWAAEGPNTFDCSGLVTAAWRLAGVELPHHSGRQFKAVKKIKRSQLRPGDLVFFYADSHHVGIYIGGGRMVHAPNEGEDVRVDLIDNQPIKGFGRVPLPPSKEPAAQKPAAQKPAAGPGAAGHPALQGRSRRQG